jgi:hypothetical protein
MRSAVTSAAKSIETPANLKTEEGNHCPLEIRQGCHHCGGKHHLQCL